jgi:hypothetical protein
MHGEHNRRYDGIRTGYAWEFWATYQQSLSIKESELSPGIR